MKKVRKVNHWWRCYAISLHNNNCNCAPVQEMLNILNSSSGLAVNFWRLYELINMGKCEVSFEWKNQNPLKRGKPANLDVRIVAPSDVTFIESKFLEPYYSGNDPLRTSYLDSTKYSKESGNLEAWITLFSKAAMFKYYNVVQLCRHLLAITKDYMKNTESYSGKKIHLKSVIWEMTPKYLCLLHEKGDYNERMPILKNEALYCERLLNDFIKENLSYIPITFESTTYNKILRYIETSPKYQDFVEQYYL